MGKFIFILLILLLPISLIVSLLNGSWADYKEANSIAKEMNTETHSWLNETVWQWKETFWHSR